MGNHVCTIDNLDVVLEEKILNPYADGVSEAAAKGVNKTMRAMVKRSENDAPVDGGKWPNPPFKSDRPGGTFEKHIAWKSENFGLGTHVATWYVRSPEYKLAHLLSNGHALYVYGTPMGHETEPDDYIRDARDKAEGELPINIAQAIGRIK